MQQPMCSLIILSWRWTQVPRETLYPFPLFDACFPKCWIQMMNPTLTVFRQQRVFNCIQWNPHQVFWHCQHCLQLQGITVDQHMFLCCGCQWSCGSWPSNVWESSHCYDVHCSVNSNQPLVYNSVKELMDAYLQQFDRISEFHTTHRLVVDPNVPPHVDPPCRTPVALKDKIHSELDEMVLLGVLRHIKEPTEWVSSVMYSMYQK